MLSATSHIELEFLTKFLNMSKLQNRLYQSLPLHTSSSFRLEKNVQRDNMVSFVAFWHYATFLEKKSVENVIKI